MNLHGSANSPRLRLRERSSRAVPTAVGRGHNANLQYLTTSGIGQEEGDPFGPRTPGIELWHRIKTFADTPTPAGYITALKYFFIAEGRPPHTTIDLLRSATDAQIVEELVLPIEWVTAAIARVKQRFAR